MREKTDRNNVRSCPLKKPVVKPGGTVDRILIDQSRCIQRSTMVNLVATPLSNVIQFRYPLHAANSRLHDARKFFRYNFLS
ncbi:hypothetical protein BJX65DRAFT_272840 [Aspergillus insuetus]